MMRWAAGLLIGGAALLAVLQFVRPAIPARPAAAEIQAPPAIRQILARDCYSCHSDERRLAWFDQIVPGYWLVRHDILTAREHLNFSTLGQKPTAAQKGTLYEAVNMIQLGAMPLPDFVRLHPESKVTPEDLDTLKRYLSPWAPLAVEPAPSGTKGEGEQAKEANLGTERANLAAVSPELNGLAFDPSFESWKPVSFTDRGDNNTFRFILGNDIAVRAAQSGSVLPWPDGARLAKIAWQQRLGSDGLIHAGKFIQVELMMKDHRQYQTTDGWGWGRWRGLNLKPYGTDARFVAECTTCHLPVRGDDFVYTMPVTTAKTRGREVVNDLATLPTSLPYHPLKWNAITMYVDPKSLAIAVLFGNDSAIRAVEQANRSGSGEAQVVGYPAGSVLALVTWAEREDPHWFGGRIPSTPQSVEFVEKPTTGGEGHYRRFVGSSLIEESPTLEVSTQRRAFILGLAPAALP